MPSSGAERAAMASAGIELLLPTSACRHTRLKPINSADSGPTNQLCRSGDKASTSASPRPKGQRQQEPAWINPAPPQFFPQGDSKMVCTIQRCQARQWWRTLLIPSLGRQKQVVTVSSSSVWSTYGVQANPRNTVRSVSKTEWKTTKINSLRKIYHLEAKNKGKEK